MFPQNIIENSGDAERKVNPSEELDAPRDVGPGVVVMAKAETE